MPEKYTGTKFETKILGDFLPSFQESEKIKKLIEVGKSFKALNMDDKNGGNISFRSDRGIVIKRTGALTYDLSEDDFVLIDRVEGDKVYVFGSGKPSSEARMHSAIYERRRDVNCVLHAHDRKIVANPDKYINAGRVKFIPYGTLELATAVSDVAKGHDYIIEEKHGVISLGVTIEEAFDLLKTYHEKE